MDLISFKLLVEGARGCWWGEKHHCTFCGLNGSSMQFRSKSGCQNVRLLRDAGSTGITVSWNYLYGFPGESDDDYASIISQIPALHHLTPADSARIEIERFSPYFNRPELGFAELRPGREYTLTYELPERELYDLAYVFDAPHRGIGDELATRLAEALAAWLSAFPRSRLTYWDLGEHVVLASERRGFAWTTLRLTDPFEVAAFRLLDQPHTLAALTRKLPDAADASVAALLHRWMELGLVFTDAGQYIHVACDATNSELLRIDGTRRSEYLPEPVR